MPDRKPPTVHNKYHRTAPPDAVYVMRGSPYGNPYIIGVHGDRDECVDLFEENTLPTLDVSALRGKDIVCCCVPLRCHAWPIFRKANA